MRVTPEIEPGGSCMGIIRNQAVTHGQTRVVGCSQLVLDKETCRGVFEATCNSNHLQQTEAETSLAELAEDC